jgi:hypothetical protein
MAMQQRTISIVASGLAFILLIVAAVALPQRDVQPVEAQETQLTRSFVEQFTGQYLLAVAQRREVQDYDLRDGRGWAKAILTGAKEKEDE